MRTDIALVVRDAALAIARSRRWDLPSDIAEEVARLTALALPVTNGAKGITSIPLPGDDTAGAAGLSAGLGSGRFGSAAALAFSAIAGGASLCAVASTAAEALTSSLVAGSSRA